MHGHGQLESVIFNRTLIFKGNITVPDLQKVTDPLFCSQVFSYCKQIIIDNRESCTLKIRNENLRQYVLVVVVSQKGQNTLNLNDITMFWC